MGVGGDYLLLTYLVSYFLCDAVQESSVSVVKGRGIICFLTYLVSHFLCDAVQEGSVGGVEGHRKHQVLPDQDSKLIRQVIEVLRLVHL